MLRFEQLRRANISRVSSFGHGDLANGWNPAEWGCALAGETGELCNVVKKMIRQAPGDPSLEVLKGMAAKELADVIIYADLLAAKLEIDLGQAVVQKFNMTSEKYGFPDRLGL